MRFFNMSAGPHHDTANDDFDDGAGARCGALRFNCRRCLSRLLTGQQFSAPAVELRWQDLNLPRDCRHVHTGLTALLNRCGLEFVGPQPPQLWRRPVKAIGHRLNHSHQPKASRRPKHRSSHSENSYVRNTLPSISDARWGLLAAYIRTIELPVPRGRINSSWREVRRFDRQKSIAPLARYESDPTQRAAARSIFRMRLVCSRTAKRQLRGNECSRS
jgi:hypothetical protein